MVAVIGQDILKSNDVLGAEDLKPSLSTSQNRRHEAVLSRPGHSQRRCNPQEFKAKQVYEQAKRYVASDAYLAALKMLAQERVVIVAGPPGVGKTTLADLLLYTHLEKGYQAVLIQRDVKEGERLLQTGVRQIFYFDDFMGATFAGDRYSAGTGVNDRALLDFIAMVRVTPTARLIVTTREHVYAQALDRSERLRQAGLGDLRVLLTMPSYSQMQRARILYNHLYFSDLPDAYRDELLRDDFYLRIVKHEKFNPRLIEWLSSFRRLRTVRVERYHDFVENYFATRPKSGVMRMSRRFRKQVARCCLPCGHLVEKLWGGGCARLSPHFIRQGRPATAFRRGQKIFVWACVRWRTASSNRQGRTTSSSLTHRCSISSTL